MGKVYSISQIGSFRNCPLQYKYRYIDRLESDLETIEAFMGTMVHEVLEEFYQTIKNKVVRDKEWLLRKFDDHWQKNYTDAIKIVKDEYQPEDYYNKGKKALEDYYDKYQPFDRTKIVATERRINFKLGDFDFISILDRIDWDDKEEIFEVHDYKTSSSLPTQEEVDQNWQLGLYHIAVKKLWPEAEKIRLIWHYLCFNKELASSRSAAEVDELTGKIVNQIKGIEAEEEFPPVKSSLCPYCDYQNICPLWKHPLEMEKAPVNEYKNDPGVKLVANYASLEEKKNELKEKIYQIEAEQEKVKEAACDYAQKEGIEIIDGPDKMLKVDIKEELNPPTKREDSEKWEGLRKLLIEEGKYQDVSTVNFRMFSYRIRNKIWPKEFVEKVKRYLVRKITKRVWLRNK